MTLTETTTPGVQAGISPQTVYVSSGQNMQQNSLADITITVQNMGAAVNVKKFAVQLPLNLYADGTSNAIVPKADTTWNFTAADEGGTFQAVPANGTSNPLPANGSAAFKLDSIVLAQQNNPTQVTLPVRITLDDANNTVISQSLALNIAFSQSAIQYFNAEPTGIQPDASSTLSWNCTDIDYCLVSPPYGGPHQTQFPGSMQVSPSGDTTYTLDAFAPGLHLQQQVTVSILQPKVNSFTSKYGDYVTNGGNVMLEWSTSPETEFVTLSTNPQISGIPSNLPLNTHGTPVSIGPITQATSFYITPGNKTTTGAGSSPVNIDILSVNFGASPNPIGAGTNHATTLSWDVQADVVSIDGIGPVNKKDTRVLNSPPNGTVYTLRAGTVQNPDMQTAAITIMNYSGPFTFSQFAMYTGSGYPGDEVAPVYGFTVDVPGSIPPGFGVYTVKITGLSLQNGLPFPDSLTVATQSPADNSGGKFYLINNTPMNGIGSNNFNAMGHADDIGDPGDPFGPGFDPGSLTPGLQPGGLGPGFGPHSTGNPDLDVIGGGVQWADPSNPHGTITLL